MESAADLFDEDCTYEDTLYPKVFVGKEQIKGHLLNVASAVPDSFSFVVDVVSEDPKTNNIGVQWHVESDGQQLPFTRGCSMYTVNAQGKIVKGFDVPEPTLKSGSLSLGLLKQAKNLIADPIRTIPLVGFAVYSWLLFFSTAAPGVNALSLDQGTWAEVRDLSLNFWLVLPIAAPASAPTLHPLLEALFNIVLVWSALFAGFLVDGKSRRPEAPNAMLPVVAGMQFLTNAFFTLYLVSREAEADKQPQLVYSRPLTLAERIGESKALPLLLLGVGIVAVLWGVEGRAAEFGDWDARLSSFLQLLRSDRLTFSFAVDCLYYSLFQGWLINDDLQRRLPAPSAAAPAGAAVAGGADDGLRQALRLVGSFVPFFGLVAYLLARPPLPYGAAATGDADDE